MLAKNVVKQQLQIIYFIVINAYKKETPSCRNKFLASLSRGYIMLSQLEWKTSV